MITITCVAVVIALARKPLFCNYYKREMPSLLLCVLLLFLSSLLLSRKVVVVVVVVSIVLVRKASY